jgi:Holliday junction DNA helicase RuvB
MARPLQDFNGFYGQQNAVNRIRNLCNGCKALAQPLPHMLFRGASGIGKTEFARATAKEMGFNFHPLLCSPSTSTGKLVEMLKGLNEGDLFFLDESHNLSKEGQELLYPVIDSLTLPNTKGAGDEGTEPVTVKPFTLILASDQFGKMLNALKRRIAVSITLEEYTLEETRAITSSYAAESGLDLSPQATTRIAEASRGIPRKIEFLLDETKIHMAAENAGKSGMGSTDREITKPEIERILKIIGVDEENLWEIDRRYLRFLFLKSKPVSLQNLAGILEIDKDTIYRDIEGYFIKRNLVDITRGRVITEAGRTLILKIGLK